MTSHYDLRKTTPPDDELPQWALEQAREELGLNATDEQVGDRAFEIAEEFSEDGYDFELGSEES